MSELERFEAEAELFYKDTGFLAPGKSEPSAANYTQDFERGTVRILMKKAWDAGRRRADDAGRLREAYKQTCKDVGEAMERLRGAAAGKKLNRALFDRAMGILRVASTPLVLVPASPSAEPKPCDHQWETLHPAEDLSKIVGRRCEVCGICEWDESAPAKEDEKR